MAFEQETVSFNLELNVERSVSSIRRLETAAYRILTLFRRLGLPEEVDAVIRKIEQIIMTVRLLQTALLQLEMSAGPVGWIMAGVGIASSVLSLADMLSGY